ncbi:outer membrane lipoprotein carrier protein LolA [Streptomyces sp. NPDC001822]|uniref:LolA family protein n=1 Tax=Streptomyces sp. NPDC001822 TaxID=3364614 RepID=UPI0036BC89B3
MAPNDSAETNGEATGTVVGRRKMARYIVPFAVVGVAAATIGLVPALAASGDPDLPDITAQELIEKIAASDQEQMSGTLRISTDLGIPSLGGIASSLAPDAGGGDASAAPESKLMELASGTHTLRLAADGPDRQRLSILGKGSEYSLVHNGDDVWGYDSESNEVYHAKSGGAGRQGGKHEAPEGVPATPKELAEKALAAADGTTSVTVDGTTQVAGRDAYRLLIKPKQSGSTIGSVRVAVDSATGVPLKFTLATSSGGRAAVDAGFTKVDFSKPDASSFSFTPPKGAKVTEADETEDRAGRNGAADEPKDGAGRNSAAGKAPKELAALEDFKGLDVIGEGWNAVATIDTPGGAGLPAQGSGTGDVPAQAGQFLDALGDKVTGDFGSGTVFRTRLVNALLTDDGKAYVGAVTQDTLVKAADAAE